MSFKGGNLVNGSPEEHAFSVVKASLNSKLVLRNSNLKYFNNARIGGASTDSALIGSFGTEKRLTYTVLGDAVNLASRLESASKHLGVENLFCEKTMKLTNNNCEFIWREVGDLIVEGKRNSIKGFEAILNNEDNRKWIDIFHKGLKYYTSKEFIDAKAEFSKVIELKFNGDSRRQNAKRQSQGPGRHPQPSHRSLSRRKQIPFPKSERIGQPGQSLLPHPFLGRSPRLPVRGRRLAGSLRSLRGKAPFSGGVHRVRTQ